MIKFKFARTIFWNICFLAGVAYLWANSGHSVLKEYELITNYRKAVGYVTKLDSWEEEVETRNEVGFIQHYFIDYTFTLPSGQVLKGSSDIGEEGYFDMQENFELNYPITIEYSKDNPSSNRPADTHHEHNSLYEIWRYHLLGGLILIIISFSFVYYILHESAKECKVELNKIVKKRQKDDYTSL